MSKRKTLFHGTDKKSKSQIVKHGIELHVNRGNQDFGDGFYLTSNKGRAKDRGDGSLLAYELDERGLNIKMHHGTSDDWKREIFEQRVNGNDVSKEYDVVVGPIADARIGYLIELLTRGEISREDFEDVIVRGKISGDIQVAIKTQKAVQHLTRKEEEER